MNDREVFVVQEYIEEHLFEPGSNWPKYHFDERSYSRWAANEILRRLSEQEATKPIAIVEEFVNKMDDYVSLNDYYTPRFIFTVARETAKDILDIFRAMY